ncbi:DegV family protein [Oceanobacillus arenosus]|uniref:DegV family protein n=1 Tax=Oceanobacillus arenosus TaxID=1229153 RepID=A0A3D8PTP4_9BACI|nr:DegV family protein [Oceanobacillus arenosus]RDW18509.1 DegV family protein [Oceanobacillus arenosus]
MAVKILADSASDLRKEHYNEFAIEMVPLTVHLDDKDYQDGITIEPLTVYNAMREGKTPKTSQVSPLTFKTIFTSYAEKNQPLVYIAFSSQLSGTYQTATMMLQEVLEAYPNAPIQIVDSKCASLGYGLVVLHAAKLASTGATIQEVVADATYQAEHMVHLFTVDDLEYLYRGGRVSKTAAFVGSLLKIKPLLHVDDGKLIPLEKIRGSKKVFGRMLDMMEERGTNFTNQSVGICHSDDLERAKQLASSISERFGINVDDIEIVMIGAVIGAHVGPGTIGIFFLDKPSN